MLFRKLYKWNIVLKHRGVNMDNQKDNKQEEDSKIEFHEKKEDNHEPLLEKSMETPKEGPVSEEIKPVLETPVKKSKKSFWKILTIIFIILFILALLTKGFTTFGITGNVIMPLGENAKLDFYVMSQCPYGTQVEDAIKPVLDEMGEAIDFNLEFISTDLGNGEFRSLHGEPETQGNIVQLCAAKYNPDKYVDMIVCQNKNAGAIPNNWESCAQELDVEKIKACFEGDEGRQLLSESSAKAQEIGASGSPTIYLNDKPYSGGRTTNDFKRAICLATGSEHKACGNIPKPVEIEMTVVIDERCKDCDSSQIIRVTEQLFPGTTTRVIDYSESEAKKLMSDVGLSLLPAYILSDKVKEAEKYKEDAQLKTVFIEMGDYFFIPSNIAGSTFNPTAEVCDNGIDDDNNELIDCADDYCKSTIECREEKENHLQVFIMSDCPYGRQAVGALKEVKDNFKDLDFEVHYIAGETPDGFRSLHGQYEVDENIVQLCVKENNPEQWFDYLYCRSTKGVNGIDWKGCAKEVNVDIDKVNTCATGSRGTQLLSEDIKIANSLGIGASPTWLANNRYQFGGISADGVKQNFCQYNVGLVGCENTLTQSATAEGSC